MKTNMIDLQGLERLHEKLANYLEARRRVVELEEDPDLAPFLEQYGRVSDLPGEQQGDEQPGDGTERTEQSPLIGETKEETILNLMAEMDEDADRKDVLREARQKIPDWAADQDERLLGDSMSRMARKGELEVTAEATRGPTAKPARYKLPSNSNENGPPAKQQESGDKPDYEKGIEILREHLPSMEKPSTFKGLQKYLAERSLEVSKGTMHRILEEMHDEGILEKRKAPPGAGRLKFAYAPPSVWESWHKSAKFEPVNKLEDLPK